MEFISLTAEAQSPTELFSPTMEVHPQLSLFLQISRSSNRVSLFPAESFPYRIILKQSLFRLNILKQNGCKSSTNHLRSLSPAETKNSTPYTLQQQSRIYFPQPENITIALHIHTSWHVHAYYTAQFHLFWEHHYLIHFIHHDITYD